MNRLLVRSFSAWIGAALALSAHPGHEGPHSADDVETQVVAVEFSDFHCAPCAEVSSELRRLVDERKVALQVVFKHAPSNPEALVAHEAALAAGQQGKFWEMHDLLFQRPKANYSEILEMAATLGLDVKRFQTSLDEREFRGRIMTEIAEARGIGIRITPTIFLNGRKLEGIDQIRAFVETALKPPADQLNPDLVYAFDLSGSPATGPEDAPVTIVEFSDFRCGFCGVHSKNITQLMDANPGKIRRVFKHFPIQSSPEGLLPHQGSMAAMAQGRFWDMYHALMNKPLTGRDDLLSRAVAIGLDMEPFERALAAQEGQKLLQRDIEEGDRLGIRMTPTTFINGRALGGRQSLEVLQQRVDAIRDPNAARPDVSAEASPRPAGTPALVEFFADFGSPDTGRLHAAIAEFRDANPETEVRFIHFPSGESSAPMWAHKAALAAEEQGKPAEMTRLILALKGDINPSRAAELAGRLGMDRDQFSADLAHHRIAARVANDIALGHQRGLIRGPALFLNGTRVEGLPSADHLTKLLDDPCCSKRRPLQALPLRPEAGPAKTSAEGQPAP